MHDLNYALDGLREVMPYAQGPSVRKLSKIATLLLAKNYILMLQNTVDEMKRRFVVSATDVYPVYPSALLAAAMSQHPPDAVAAAAGTLLVSPPLPPHPGRSHELSRINPLRPAYTGSPPFRCSDTSRLATSAAESSSPHLATNRPRNQEAAKSKALKRLQNDARADDGDDRHRFEQGAIGCAYCEHVLIRAHERIDDDVKSPVADSLSRRHY